MEFVLAFFLTLSLSAAQTEESGFCINCSLEANSTTLNKKTQEDLGAIADKIQPIHQMHFLTPELVENTDSRKLAEMIVQRLHDKCDSIRDPSKTAPDENESDIIMLVPTENLAGIAKNGFKNQHQTSSTKGADAKSIRITMESQHVGIEVPYTHKGRELLPKYALQVFNNEKMGKYFVPWHYGNVMFRFKPEVKKRSTWSETDSLIYPIPLRTNFIKAAPGRKCRVYCEAQIWGELDTTDVASLIVEEGSPITDEMKSMGVPIYTYKTNRSPPLSTPVGGYNSCNEGASPSKTSLCKTTFSTKPVFTPTSKPTAPSTPNSREALALFEKETGKAQKNIYKSHYLAKMPTPHLFKKYQDLVKTEEEEAQIKKEAAIAKGGLGFYQSYSHDNLSSERVRLLAELTARPKTQEITDLLLKEVKSDTNDSIRSIALLGLSHLKEEDLKPLIKEGLSKRGLHNKTASAMARKYQDDPEIAKLLIEKGIIPTSFMMEGKSSALDMFKACKKEN